MRGILTRMDHQTIIQSRVHAETMDQAVLKIRARHSDYDGRLVIKLVYGDWYEYCFSKED